MFCRNCGKGLILNPDKTCPGCGSYVMFCRNCGKGLVLNPDKTCANCGANAVEATSFCRYCGKPTSPQDLTCPACSFPIKTIPDRGRILSKKTQRLVKIVHLTIVVALITIFVWFTLPHKVTEQVLIGLTIHPAPVPKIDTSKNVSIDLAIQNGTFYPDVIYAEEGANLIITFTNQDAGIEHNFVLYRPGETGPSPSFIQKRILGPGKAVFTIKVPRVRPDGEYWFACDNHYEDEQGLFYSISPTP